MFYVSNVGRISLKSIALFYATTLLADLLTYYSSDNDAANDELSMVLVTLVHVKP